MAGYAKVFASILTSSLWCKDHEVLRIWIAMLACCDTRGVVEGSIPGFASLCRVTNEEMERAIEIFTSPDPYSRTPDHEGRRLEVVPGGWKILNYKAYRDKGQDKEGSKAPFMRALRARTKADGEGNALPPVVTGYPTATAVKDVPATRVSSVVPKVAPKADLEPQRQEILNHWRAVAVPAGLPDVLKGTSLKLQGAMNTRLKDPAWLGLYREAVEYAARHPAAGWMRGESERRWKVSLEWLLKPDKAEETVAKARAAPARGAPPRPGATIAADASTQVQVQQLSIPKLARVGGP